MNPPINSSAELAIRENLEARLRSIKGAAFSSEIQDGGEFLLLCIDLPDSATPWPPAAGRQVLTAASADVVRDLPEREGEYRWMVVVRRNGEVIDSTMGGWIGRPTI